MSDDVLKLSECPKCGLEAKSLLHPFCTHKGCPIKAAIREREAKA